MATVVKSACHCNFGTKICLQLSSYQCMFNLFQLLLHLTGWLLYKTAKQGAQTSIHLAVSEDVKGVTGSAIQLMNSVYIHTCTYSQQYISIFLNIEILTYNYCIAIQNCNLCVYDILTKYMSCISHILVINFFEVQRWPQEAIFYTNTEVNT